MYTTQRLCIEFRPVTCTCETESLTGYINRTAAYIQNEVNFNESSTDPKVTAEQLPYQLCLLDVEKIGDKSCEIVCRIDETRAPDCVTGTVTFWMFVLCLCLGTIGFNVTNSATDATCFDILGMITN